MIEADSTIRYGVSVDSPFGPISIIATEDAIVSTYFGNLPQHVSVTMCALTEQAKKEMQEYLAGYRFQFNLPLDPKGTPFQLSVWRALQEIPFGETRSYKQIATAIGNPNACRAVGMANNRNPIGIIIPCHRVIGADGNLVGYAGGLEYKKFLLDLEARHAHHRNNR